MKIRVCICVRVKIGLPSRSAVVFNTTYLAFVLLWTNVKHVSATSDRSGKTVSSRYCFGLGLEPGTIQPVHKRLSKTGCCEDSTAPKINIVL